MSKFLGTLEVQGNVYVSGLGGYTGTYPDGCSTLQSIVRKELFRITEDNFSDYHYTGPGQMDHLDLAELSDKPGVQIEYSNTSTLLVDLPGLDGDVITIGKEFTILNLSNMAGYITISSSGGVSSNRSIIATPTSGDNTVSTVSMHLGFLKAVRLKAVKIPTNYTMGNYISNTNNK